MTIQGKGVILSVMMAMVLPSVRCQEVLTLDDFRQSALESAHTLQRAAEKVEETKATKNVALWQMLPKVSANGTYMWTEKSVSLLSDEQKERLSNVGTNISNRIQSLAGTGLVSTELSNLLGGGLLPGVLDGMGGKIVDALETDTRNVAAGMVTVTQPLFMGGKLVSLYRTASLLHEMAGLEYDKTKEDMLIGVDEAYWQVVSVKHKKELAEMYAALLDTLNSNVEAMVAAEMATRGDLTKVRVKLGEAQMNLTKATNGLTLAKMLLAERAGMALDREYDVKGVMDAEMPLLRKDDDKDMESVWQRRSEMRMLRIGDSIAQQSVVMARSTLLPNVAVTGGYLVSNPSMFNGFQNSWDGTWMAGVVVNVPILHPGGFYAVRAAKARQRALSHDIEEAKKMIELQVNKARFELELAYKKYEQALSSVENAEENLKLANESFEAGAASTSDVMAAQTAWLKAKGELLDARIEIEMNTLYLGQALGD